LTGGYVPAGNGLLTTLEVEGVGDDACLDDLIVSGIGGEGLDVTIEDCFTINYELEDIYGCLDANACNYNPDATADDDSCEYPEENFDCNGDCIVDIDCAGVCDGDAEYDECGECDGDGIGDDECDGDGNIDLGCGCGEAGPSGCDETCDSTLEFDDCGVCGGDGSTCLPYFNVEIAETGQSTLFIFEDSITSLDPGDEVGVFDLGGFVNGDGELGEVLVGAGVWDGYQLEVVGIMGEDLTAFGGPILPGAVAGNPLSLKVWNAEQEALYSPALATKYAGEYNASCSALHTFRLNGFPATAPGRIGPPNAVKSSPIIPTTSN
jgi:hypothetical protein